MDTLESHTIYVVGKTYSFTVYAPNSEDGAKAWIWGFYKNTNNAWVQTTFGTGSFENGYATVSYTLPSNFKSDVLWAIEATQHPDSGSKTLLYNTHGEWGMFDTYMLNGQTIEIETYRFDNFSMDRNTASFQMNSVNGNPPDAYSATVQVIRPWNGDINDYNNALYNNTDLYNKKAFYPTYAENLGYVVEEVASNPGSPSFQQIRVTKPGTDYDMTLFGYRISTPNDPLGYMWETTFHIAPLTNMEMEYNPATGDFKGSFDEPVPYNTQFCFQPSVMRTTPEAGVYFSYSSGGSMDLIFTGRQLEPTELYVDVPQELIPGDYTQTYSIKATELHEGLRSVKIDLMVPKADFVQPNVNTDFSLGSAFDTYDLKMLMPVEFDDSDPVYYIYTLTGAYGGGFHGIIGEDVELLRVTLTSEDKPYSNTPDGCLIKINPDTVIMKNDQNPYAAIECAGTTDGLVLIDAEDPNVVIVNIDDYPDGMTLQVDGDGAVLPELDLLYKDNYDLATALWMILPAGEDAPTDPVDFDEDNEVGEVDGEEELIENWELPADGLADGTYVLYLLVTDEAGNFFILPWEFTIDTVAPTALTWVECRTTPDANISVDLEWAFDADNAPAFINIWVLDYAEIVGIDSHAYPEYDPTNLIEAGTIINDIDPYQDASALGWKLVKKIPVTTEITLDESEWTAMERGYYYFTIYGEADNGQMSDAPADPFYRESISYWPGDVVEHSEATSVVTSHDIAQLSAVWGLTSDDTDWNKFVDVGPTVDYARRSRPTPDGVIDIEDLMIFAMNYNNTVYTFYNRGEDNATPINIEPLISYENDLMRVDFVISENSGFLRGMNIPFGFGSGLDLQNVELGEIWPENSVVFHTNEDNMLTLSASTLGEDALAENGVFLTVKFRVSGNDVSTELFHMLARDLNNEEVEILNNPDTNPTSADDNVIVIPDTSYLGSNYPNPFNPSTTIQYGLKQAGNVKIGVYNSRGQLVRTLVSEAKAAGTYTAVWNGLDNYGRAVSSGIYFFRMDTADKTQVQKALLMK